MKLLLFGETNVGKDTVALMIAKRAAALGCGNVETIALADPMKRITQKLFGCTDHQLWGPSSARNGISIPSEHPLTCHYGTLPNDVFYAAEAWLRDDVQVADVPKALDGFVGWVRTLREYSGANDGKNVGLSPRKVLQTLGTEWGRGFDPRVWIKAGARTVDALLEGGQTYDRRVGLIESPTSFAGSVIVTDGRFRNELVGLKVQGFKVVNITAPAVPGTAAIATHGSEREQKTIPQHWFDARIFNSKDGLGKLEEQVRRLVDFLYFERQWSF